MGALAAIFVQPVLALVWTALPALLNGEMVRGSDLVTLTGLVTLVAAVAVLAMGVPAFHLLLRVRPFSSRRVGALGFALGALPVALLAWPAQVDSGYSASRSWHGLDVTTVVNGVTTMHGWLIYLEGVLVFGVHGWIGALAFGWAWSKCRTTAQAPVVSAR